MAAARPAASSGSTSRAADPAASGSAPRADAITGTPTAAGTFTILVTDANKVTSSSCTFTIQGPPVVTCSAVNTGEVGVAFNSPQMMVSGGTAPDLGQRTGGSYTPSLMAARMWDHAPEMWSAMKEQGVARPELTEQDAIDLFAYFYAARYFDPRGDAARGAPTLR